MSPLIIFMIFPFFAISESQSVHNLSFMFVTSFGQSGFNASGVVPAADIALEDINSHPDVLQGYHLMYDKVRDSQCNRGTSLDLFLKGVLLDTTAILGVVGFGCSTATEPVAEIIHQWNISLISYASRSPVLSNRSRFKSFFRNTFNLQIIAPALRSAMLHFNWTRIAILTQDEDLFTETESDIRSELKSAGITVDSQVYKTDEIVIEVIEEFFVIEENFRIFYLNAYPAQKRRVLCCAYQQNLLYPRYVWIMYEDYLSPLDVPGDHDCTDEELATVLNGAIILQVINNSNETSDNGISLMTFNNNYEERGRREGFSTSGVAYNLYDALWLFALALNNTDAMVKSGDDISRTGCESVPGSLVPLEEFSYSNGRMGCLIQWNLQQTNFYGLTGRVLFDENGTRILTNIQFRHYQLLEGGRLMRTLFATMDKADNFTFTFQPGKSERDIYPGGIPLDGTPIKIVRTFKPWLTGISYVLATLGIVASILCFVFNLIFRRRKVVRLSSPTLNFFIAVGAFMMYASIFFYLLPTNNEKIAKVHCVVEHWLFTVGYSLAFGAVLAKMWRVYQIFHNPQPKKKILTDWRLVVIVLVIAAVAVLLLVIEEAVPYLRGEVVLAEDRELSHGVNSVGIREDYCVWVCQEASSNSFFWEIFIFGYLLMLQIIGMVLAFQTRRVKLRGLRDSKEIAAIIYISSIAIVVMSIENFTLTNYINIGIGIFMLSIFVLTTIFLFLIFFPKMYLLFKDPHGKNAAVVNSQGDSKLSGFSSFQKQTNVVKCVELEKKVTLLELAVQEKDKTITLLKHGIGTSNPTLPTQVQEEKHVTITLTE